MIGQEGGELFSALCMWVDVNQKYVELGLFPQWYDIARELNIDDMKTEWVKVGAGGTHKNWGKGKGNWKKKRKGKGK